MKIAEIEQRESWAYLCRRVPYYGINIAAPYILMRHWAEWEKQKTFEVDQTDRELCQLVMEIQMYSQKHFFGKYAEMYYDEKQQEEAANAVRHTEKMTGYYNAMAREFTIDEMVAKIGFARDYARVVCNRWEKEGLVKKAGRGSKLKMTKTRSTL